MRKLMTAAAIAAASAALGAALPAAAQSFGPGGFGPGYERFESRRLETRIEHASRTGVLSPWQARELDRRLDDTRRLQWRFARDGYVDGREARELDRRYEAINAQLIGAYRGNRYEDGWRGGHGFGWRR